MSFPKVPVLYQLAVLIEEMFKHDAPVIAQAATTAAVQAAVEQAAVGAATQDPKVQAGIALFQAAQAFKQAVQEPTPSTPPAPPAA